MPAPSDPSKAWLLGLVCLAAALSFAPQPIQAQEPSWPGKAIKSAKVVKAPRLLPPAEVPAALQKILARAHIPPEAVSLLVMDASGQQPPRLSHRADELMNPASVMKLVTTYAALDTLGSDFTWKTRVILDGDVKEGAIPSWWSSACKRC